ncbi:MAG: NUDIX hydrolase N-terminal domain-containing protein [Alphaproteobacteria bacterium]|nr:NUDIX hydrolase N-terminal domain-containing protein [Alphaproteobacteria bacterium]
MSSVISVKGVLIEGGSVVLLENERGEWELPGGRPEPGEDVATALVREFAEELGIEIVVGPIIDCWNFEVLSGRHVTIVTYAVARADRGELQVSDEHRRFAWFPLHALDTLPLPAGYRRSIHAVRAAEPTWLGLARELHAIAQTGLHYAGDQYDTQRYARLRVLATEMMAMGSGAAGEQIAALFCQDIGYATPRVGVRGAAFRDGKILMVREAMDGRWAMPGGWADVNQTPRECVEREIWEESGFTARAVKLAAIWDRRRQGFPPSPLSIYTMSFICELTGGTPQTSLETTEIGFFDENELPDLSPGRNQAHQIRRMFAHYRQPELPAEFD